MKPRGHAWPARVTEKGSLLQTRSHRPRRASSPANELAGGNDVSVEKNKIFIGPDEGVSLPALNMVHKVTAERSGGTLTVIEWSLSPGAMIPPHTHAREDECSFVLEGELRCEVGGQIVVAPAGSYVLKPRGRTMPCTMRAPSQYGSWSSSRRAGWKPTSTSTSRSRQSSPWERPTRRSAGGPGPSSGSATGSPGTTSASPRPEPASASGLSRAVVPTDVLSPLRLRFSLLPDRGRQDRRPDDPLHGGAKNRPTT